MPDDLNKANETADEARDSKQSSAGRIILWVSFWTGLFINAVEVFYLYNAVKDMMHGSCTAALIGMGFGLLFVPIALIAFTIGAVLAKRENRRAWRAGLAGLWLSVAAVPFWYIVASLVTGIFHLG